MAAPKTRVSRGGGEDFPEDDKDQLTLGSDTALVGDPGDGASIIAEERDDPEWDVTDTGTTRKLPEKTVTDVEPPEFDEEDTRLAYSDQGDADVAPRSRSRRSARNMRQRMAQDAVLSENSALKAQLDALTGTVSRLVTGQQGLAVDTLESQYSAMQGQLRVVDDEMANAIKNADGDTYSRAQRLRDELVGRMHTLKIHRDHLAAQESQDDPRLARGGTALQQQQQQQQPAPPDPRVVDYFERFRDRFSWFDPASADADSNIVRAVDAELANDGYQRHTPVFWQRLERRLADYGLKPGRGEASRERDDDVETQDERPGRQAVTPRSRPPTNGARSAPSGRSPGFRLNEMQTNILREEGLLEENLSDGEKAKRQRIVDKWKRGAAADRRGA